MQIYLASWSVIFKSGYHDLKEQFTLCIFLKKQAYLTNLKMISDHLEQDPILSHLILEFYPLRVTSFLDFGKVFANTMTNT